MDRKRFVLGLATLFLCTSMTAFAADIANTASSVPDIDQPLQQGNLVVRPFVGSAEQCSDPTSSLPTRACSASRNLPKGQTLSGPLSQSADGIVIGELRAAPANDECENAELVSGPYPTTICGTNVDATYDCPSNLNQPAVWYEITLPHARNNLVVDFCSSDFGLVSYQIGTVLTSACDDCDSLLNSPYEWHNCGDGTSNPFIWWNDLPGPTTVMLPLFINPSHDFCVEIDVTEVVTPANDTCEHAELVTGPYPTTVCGTTVGSTVDCPDTLNWKGVWYEVELPYAVNTIETDYCPSDFNMNNDSVGIVYYEDCSDCYAAVEGSYAWYDCGNLKRNPTVWWRDVPGPGTIKIPVYISTNHDYCIEFRVRPGDCEFDCPTNGVAENETCGSDTNGGCNMPTPAFEPLACGQSVCGTGWADMGRDTDWFEITITEPVTMTFTVESQFLTGVSAGMMEPYTPGVVGCDKITGTISPWTTAGDCEQAVVEYNALPGTYWWFVGPNGFTDMPCGGRNDYVATMNCEPWDVRGACCDDDSGTCTDDVRIQDCPDPMRFGGKDVLCTEMAPPCGGCPESMIELEFRTDNYPNETTWTITDHNDPSNVLSSGGPYERQYWTYFEYVCVGANDCVDLNVYDLAGDGQSWWSGGYAARLDGVEICSTLQDSWSGYESHCTNLGGGCDAGRCCYDPWPNCADVSFLDCISLYDGLWSEGKTCSEDPCQNPDAPDFEVVAPYTSPQRSTCGALNRCHPVDQYYETPEHVYKVTIPYDGVWSFNTCLDNSMTTWLGVGTSLCSTNIGWSAWACNNTSSEVVAHVAAGDYYVDVEAYDGCGNYVFDVHEIPVCDTQCPAGSTIESEMCGTYSNDGCWGWPNTFEPISLKEHFCGTVFADNGSDSDWFEYVADKDRTVVWTVRSNFDGKIGVVQQNVPGQPGCDNVTGTIDPVAYPSDCEDASVTFDVTAGGTYYLFVGHEFYYGAPCGTTNDYVATLQEYEPVCGDLDGDDDVDYDDYAIFLDAFGGPVDGTPPQDDTCDYDNSGAVGMSDFATWLDCYRDFIGDPQAGPPSKPQPERPRRFTPVDGSQMVTPTQTVSQSLQSANRSLRK